MRGTNDKVHDEQAKLWNGPAGQAWVDTQELLDRLFKPFEDRLVEGVPAHAGASVLDVGCGTGGTTLAAARRLGPGGHAVGIDLSEAMINAARVRAERAEQEGSPVRFLCADAQDHAFEPASFDRILSRFGVMFFSDPVCAFTNLRRAARDGGALRFIAWRSPAENPFMTTAERAAAPLLPDLPPRRPGAPGQFGLADPERVRSILTTSGWSELHIEPLDVECTLTTGDLLTYMTRLGPVGLALQQASAEARAHLIETVRAAFTPYVHGTEARFVAACWLVDAAARP